MRKTKPFSREWETLISEHVSYVRKICYYHTKEWDTAKDLAQDVLEVVLNQESNFTSGTYIKAWLRRVCYNEFINHCRRTKKEVSYEAATDALYESKSPLKVNQNEGEYALLKETVDKAIGKLKKDEQQIMNLLVQDYQYDQIAEQMGININAVRSKIFRARAKLEQLMPSLNPNQQTRKSFVSINEWKGKQKVS